MSAPPRPITLAMTAPPSSPHFMPPSFYPPSVSPEPPPLNKTYAIAAAAVGGVALALSWLPGGGLVLGLAGVGLGVVGIMRSTRLLSVVGLALSGLAMVINLMVLAVLIFGTATTGNGSGTQAETVSIGNLPAPATTVPSPSSTPTSPVTTAPEVIETTDEPEVAETTDEPEVVETTEAPSYDVPKRGHFDLTVKTTSKKCFGSAGCNLGYKIKAGWSGTYDPAVKYDITFELVGSEDGAIIGTFSVEGDMYSGYDLSGSLSTDSSSQRLSARVTDIEEA